MSSTESNGNSLSRTAAKAATLIDENLHWGADAVSNLAKQTAGQFERATDYAKQAGQQVKRQATRLGETASQHPGYTLLIAGAVGFTLGFLLRGSRMRT